MFCCSRPLFLNMETEIARFPYFTWDFADDLEQRFKKTLYHGGKKACMATVSPAALTDLAVSIYVSAASSPKRKLTAGYIGSVAKRFSINPCTMMVGLLYCERLRQINPDYLNNISSSDLFVVSLIISSKFLNDEGEDNEIFNGEWAEAGGLAIGTVNRLEREFLHAIQWKVHVGPQEFLLYCSKLETQIAMKHGLLRGWFSYTDLTRILSQMHYLETMRNAINSGLQVVVGCTLMYGLSLGVILSSAVCLNTSLAKTSLPNTQDVLHPYTERTITRARSTEQVNTTSNYVMNTMADLEAHSNNKTSVQYRSLVIGDQAFISTNGKDTMTTRSNNSFRFLKDKLDQNDRKLNTFIELIENYHCGMGTLLRDASTITERQCNVPSILARPKFQNNTTNQSHPSWRRANMLPGDTCFFKKLSGGPAYGFGRVPLDGVGESEYSFLVHH